MNNVIDQRIYFLNCARQYLSSIATLARRADPPAKG